MLAKHVWPVTARICNGALEINGRSIPDLTHQFGTPLYVFDETTIRDACRRYREAFEVYGGEVIFCYASKALLNIAIAKVLLEEGFGFDAVSLGELLLALRAGADAQQIHLHGNAKPLSELEQALHLDVGRIAVDNLDELETLIALTEQRGRTQKILLRIEPAVASATHSAIQTGQRGSKFGLALEQVDAFADRVNQANAIELVGLHCHLGSQLYSLTDYAAAVSILLDVSLHLQEHHHIHISEVSPGGGLAAAYLERDAPPQPVAWAQQLITAIVEGCRARGLVTPALILEPGRSITARAGIGVYQVVGSKPIDAKDVTEASRYLHVDGGMGDNLRPALYGARYTAVLANRAAEPATETVHVAGRYCESGDLLLRNGSLPCAEVGDLIAFATAGAYTLSMASNYNMVPRPAVVMVDRNGRVSLIQRRETFDDLITRDQR